MSVDLSRFGFGLDDVKFPQIEKREVYIMDRNGQPVLAEDYYAVVNQNCDYVYDVVTNRYEIVRHEEVVDAVKKALDNYEIQPTWFDIRLSGKQGARMFVKVLWHETTVNGDELQLGMLVTNSYDRSMGIGAGGFGLRIACQNQMVFGREIAFEYTLHTKNVHERLTEMMPNILEKLEGIVNVVELAMSDMVTLREVAELIQKLYLGKKRTERLLQAIASYIDRETADLLRKELEALEKADKEEKLARLAALEDYDAPRWWMYNAFTETFTHHAGRVDEYTTYYWQKKTSNELIAPVIKA